MIPLIVNLADFGSGPVLANKTFSIPFKIIEQVSHPAPTLPVRSAYGNGLLSVSVSLRRPQTVQGL